MKKMPQGQRREADVTGYSTSCCKDFVWVRRVSRAWKTRENSRDGPGGGRGGQEDMIAMTFGGMFEVG